MEQTLGEEFQRRPLLQKDKRPFVGFYNRKMSVRILKLAGLVLFVFLNLVAVSDANPTEALVLETEAECREILLSEKYCQEAFAGNSSPVLTKEITDKASLDTASPGGDLSDPIWRSEEMFSVSKGVGAGYNNPLIFIFAGALLLLFVLFLIDWKKILRRAHLDLLFLAGAFSLSFMIYFSGNLPLSVFINAAILFVLMVRMLFFSGGRSEGLSPSLPTGIFLIAIAVLLPLRAVFALVIGDTYDVGYSGVLGAKLVLEGKAIYGSFPPVVTAGDTYGPFNYYSYIPFQLLFPLKEIIPFYFDSLAAKWHTLFFDLASMAVLFFIGREIGGRSSADSWAKRLLDNRLGAILLFAYLVFPLTSFAVLGASNDVLPTFFILLSFLFFLKRKSIPSGAALSLGMMAKFFPGLLAPLFSRINPKDWRSAASFFAAFLLVALVCILPTVFAPGLGVFWQETFYIQMSRLSPHSLWGQTGISALPATILVIALALLGFAFPRKREAALVAAFAAAILLAYQSSQMHWFYTYFIWVYPLVMIALLSKEAPRATLEKDPTTPPRHQHSSLPRKTN